MKIEVKKTIWPSLISSGVILVLGLLLFFKSSVTLMGISYIFGGLIIAIGVLAIVRFISNILLKLLFFVCDFIISCLFLFVKYFFKIFLFIFK